MPASLRPEHGNIYRLDIHGRLAKRELDRAQEDLLAGMKNRNQSAARLLVRLEDFQGWIDDAGWNDLSFYITHGDRIEKVAIVGDDRWRDPMRMFAAADIRKGAVQFFDPAALETAREWLAE